MFTVQEGPALVKYDDWPEWRTDRAHRLPPAPLIPKGAHSCGLCWGAGRFWEPAGNGEGLVPRVCGHCAGAGMVAAS